MTVDIAAILACAELGFPQILTDDFPNQKHVKFINAVNAWSDINIALKLAPEVTKWFEGEGLKGLLTAKEFITKVNSINGRLIDPKCPVCSSGMKLIDVIQGDLCCKECTVFFERAAKTKSNFECANHYKCYINYSSLERCKACRYKKCVKAGLTHFVEYGKPMEGSERVDCPSHNGAFGQKDCETGFMTPGGYRVNGPQPSAIDPTQSVETGTNYSTLSQQAYETAKRRLSQKVVGS